MYGIKDNKTFEKIQDSIGIKFQISGGGTQGTERVYIDLPQGIDTENYYVSGVLKKSYGADTFQPYMGVWTSTNNEIYPHIGFDGSTISVEVIKEARSAEYIIILTELPVIEEVTT